MTTVRRFGHMRPTNQFVVASVRTKPVNAKVSVDYDYCGSIASALRACDERAETGAYKRITFHRLRVTKSRKRGSRRYMYRSNPVEAFTLAEVIQL